MIKISPKGTVPVLFLKNEQKTIDQSLDILKWALSNKG